MNKQKARRAERSCERPYFTLDRRSVASIAENLSGDAAITGDSHDRQAANSSAFSVLPQLAGTGRMTTCGESRPRACPPSLIIRARLISLSKFARRTPPDLTLRSGCVSRSPGHSVIGSRFESRSDSATSRLGDKGVRRAMPAPPSFAPRKLPCLDATISRKF